MAEKGISGVPAGKQGQPPQAHEPSEGSMSARAYFRRIAEREEAKAHAQHEPLQGRVQASEAKDKQPPSSGDPE